MKLTALILTIGCVHAFAAGFSQGKISLNLKNAPLKNVINSIQHNSDYRFIYSDDILPKDKKVTANFYNADLNEVLNFVFQSTLLTYKVLENNLIVISSQQPIILMAVTGSVQLKDNSGNISSHAGVSVVEKGTSNGTTTNETGAFTLNVKDANAVLVVSFVGYKSQEIALNGKTNVNIILEEESKELQTVVVTALGITRQKRSLTYATQSLNNNDVTAGREINITDELNGKVAGLTINKTNAGPGSSNRIVFRGNRSITGNNQPLLIVDGVRLDNDPKALADVTQFGTRDNGDGISNINPDDIESVTVLTGASAAALYGSDASNGAIVITTKKGRTGRGIGIQISSSAMFENPMIYPKLQNIYGQGDGGQFVDNSEDSWGPKMTGQQVTDWTDKSQALTPQPNNFKNFFNTGSEFINALALSTGNEKSQTYFSYTNTLSKGIMPNNIFKRNNLNLRQTVQLTSKLSFDMKANYIVEDVQNRPFTGGGNHALVTLYSMPRSLRLSDIENYETLNPDGTLTQNYWAPPSPNNQNPYWSVYRNLYERKRNRFIGLISAKYQFTPALSIQARSSIDYYTDNAEEKDYNNTYWLTDYPGQGNYIVDKESNKWFNNDVLLSFNKNLGDDFNLNINAGASIEQFRYERTIVNTQGLNAPNIFALSNGVSLSPNINNYYPEAPFQRTEKQSLYASAQLSLKNYLFLDLTGRNDWNSTLPVDNASYFFPSAGLSAILSDMLKLPEFISLLKARGSYAYVGNGTAYNQLKPSHVLVPGGNGGFLNLDRTLRDADLKPEQTRSFETGLELGLFKDRFHVEATYYKTNTRNQILTIGVPNPSGYAFRIINAGNIQNSGIELLMNAMPVQTKNFKWNINLIFGHNKNKVIALDSLQTMPPLSSPETLGMIVVRQGGSYGEIYTSSFVRNDNGQTIVDDNGLPMVETDVAKHFAGNYNPDWTAGITNTFTYTAFSLSVSIDERKGGVIVSGTQALETGNGVSELTLANHETPFIVPNSVKQDGSKNDVQVTAQDYWMHVGSAGGNPVGELFTYSATSIRMREATLTYTLPSKILDNAFIKGASISLVGRNLFFLKNNAYGFDPESALGTGNNQGLEFATMPSTRSYGVYVKLNF
jgi:TonB-linked SusC/RagA family outer membrane protein